MLAKRRALNLETVFGPLRVAAEKIKAGFLSLNFLTNEIF
jgi:hypothetical protein